MNQATITALLPYLLSVATPHVGAVLNDPRPNRRWLRLLVAAFLVLGGAAIEQAQAGVWSWEGYLRSVGIIFVGSQSVFRLLRDAYLGKLERLTGPGLGAILDLGKSKTGSDGEAATRLRELKTLLDAGVLSQDEYDAKRAEIVGAL
jgi:hypothetical protein